MGLSPGQTNNPNGRPIGARNRRTEQIWKILEARGDTDPLDYLSNIVTNGRDENLRITAANYILPFKHSKRGPTPAPRYVEDAIQVPEFVSVREAEDFLADISRRAGAGELELQSALDISTLVKNWILSVTARNEFDLKLQAQGGGPDQTIHITGGLSQLPGTSIIGMESYPTVNNELAHANGHNGHVIDHQEPPPLTESAQSEGQGE
jgi:hypothetical protein